MPEARGASAEADEDAVPEEAPPEGAFDLDALVAAGDVPGLLALARACRAGTAPGGRDMKRCLAAYRAAAELGSADGEYAVALFLMAGGIVPQDLKEGTSRLRAAAEKGSVPAKVYLGNLYELGIHYRADPEKADVWYRNAARSAGLTSASGTDEHARELAELGCVRYVLAVTASGALPEADRARLLQRARSLGHGLRIGGAPAETARTEDGAPAGDRPTFLAALDGAAAAGKPAAAPTAAAAAATPTPAPKPPAPAKVAKRTRPSSIAEGLAAFGYALLFAVAGVGAGFAAALGARELVAHGGQLPALGTRTHLVFPIVLAVVGVLPNALVYRLGALLRALVAAAALGGAGWIAWGTGEGAIHPQRGVQALAFALAGLLAALLVLGLLGGTKKHVRGR
jgi:hypothetical protein